VNLDSYQGGIFASNWTNNNFLDASLTYGANNYSVVRPGVIDTIGSSPDGNTFAAAGRAGHLFDAGGAQLGPIAEFLYTNTRIGSYRESGDSLITMGVQGQNFDSLTAGVGVQVRTVLPGFGGFLSPYASLTFDHGFLGGARTITSFDTNAPLLLLNTGAGYNSSYIYGKVAGGSNLDFGRGIGDTVTGSSTFGAGGRRRSHYQWRPKAPILRIRFAEPASGRTGKLFPFEVPPR
jgi:hypothetical protein